MSSEERELRWRNWMQSAQQGDAACYTKLLEELLPHLRLVVGRRLGDSSQLEDVVQTVLISLHRARHTYRAERPFSPWLHAIARNAVIDRQRSLGRRNRREISLEAEGVTEPSVAPTQEGAEDTGLSREMQAALASISPIQREAVTLIHVEGLSVAEAAARAGVSKTALKVRAHRGYKALRATLEAGR